MSAGESVLRTLLLINGGAAVAVLAFLGNVMPKTSAGVTVSVHHFTSGLLRFTAAVGVIGAGAVLRFLSLWHARTRYRRIELTCSVLAVLAGVASLWLFVCGCRWVAGGMW